MDPVEANAPGDSGIPLLLRSPWPPRDPPSPELLIWSRLAARVDAARPAVSPAPWSADPWRPLGSVLLDVGSEEDFLEGHVPGACHLPADALASRGHELPPRWRPLLLTARDAAARESAAARLRDDGRRGVFIVDEDPRTWPGRLETGPPRCPAWEPRPVLLRAVPPARPDRRALDLACGSGRQAVSLALMGYDVLAVDILPDALEMTSRLAKGWRVPVATERMDLTRTDPLAPSTFDLICVFRYLERGSMARLEGALRPGGRLIYETFTQAQASRGRPRNPRYLLAPGELLRAFPGLRIVDYAEGADEAGDELAVLVAEARAPSEGADDDG